MRTRQHFQTSLLTLIKPRLGEFDWTIILIGVIMFDVDHFDTLATISPLGRD